MCMARMMSGLGWGLCAGTLDLCLGWKHESDKQALYVAAGHWSVLGMLIPFMAKGGAHPAIKGLIVGCFSTNALLARQWDTAQNAVGASAPFSLGLGALLAVGTLHAPISIGRGLGTLWASGMAVQAIASSDQSFTPTPIPRTSISH